MTTTYQLLPPLATDDLERLRASIRERGVEMPIVVDEDGNILDGHTRSGIAAEFGIDCPRIVRAGLSEHEKRLLAVTLNLARRQLTDAQKVLLGRTIEPDVAARSAERQREIGKAPTDPLWTSVQKGTTRDEVARTVGLSSGRTYERQRQVVEQIEDEPDGPQLIADMERGDLTIREASDELRARRDAEVRHQARAEQAMSHDLLSIVIPPGGRTEQSALRAAFTTATASTRKNLISLKADRVADVLDGGDADRARRFLDDLDMWSGQLRSALGRGLRLVEREGA